MTADSGRRRPSESSRYLPVIKAIEDVAERGQDRLLSSEEIDTLNWNAKRVAAKYWKTKTTSRSAQSVQNQLNRPRWKYLDQAPEARRLIEEIAEDAGMTMAYHPVESEQ